MTKFFISIIICLIPSNILRIYLLNFLKNYEVDFDSHIGFGTIILARKATIKNSKIGFLNIINVKCFDTDNSNIANLNIIKKFYKFKVSKGSIIGSYNKIIGKNINEGSLIMNKSQFSTENLINVNNEFSVGENVVFGGKNSKINVGLTNKPTIIKNNVYFGTSVFVIAGIKIQEGTLIGAGSVVTKNIEKNGLYVSHKIQKVN